MKVCHAIVAGAVFLALLVPVTAQEAPDAQPGTNDGLPDLMEYLKTLARDVKASGNLGIDDSGSGSFFPDNSSSMFSVTYAIDRETMKGMRADCPEPGLFQGRGVMCHAEIKGELTFDGPRTDLLIFEVTQIVAPNSN